MKRIFYTLILMIVTIFTVIILSKRNVSFPSPVDSERDVATTKIESKPQTLKEERSKRDDLLAKETPHESTPTQPFFKNHSLEIAINFEDKSLTSTQTSRISQDLNYVYSHLVARMVEHGDQKQIVFEGEGRIWPDALNFIWMIRESGENQSLNVTTDVSNAYLKAFQFIEDNEIDERGVDVILTKIESGSSQTDSLTVFSLQSISEPKIKEALNELSKGKIKRPSVLSYQASDFNDVECVIAESTYLKIEKNSVTFSQRIALIRVDNKWKIAL